MKYVLIGIILVAALAYLIDTFIRWLHYRKEKRKWAAAFARIRELIENKKLAIPSVHEGAESWPEAERKIVNDDTLDDIYLDSAKRYDSLYGECKEVGQPVETVFIHKDDKGRTYISDTFKHTSSAHERAESLSETEREIINDDTLDAMRYAALWAQESQAQSASMDYYLGAEAAPSPDFGGFGGGDFSGGGASGDWGSSDTGSADAGGSFGND